MVNHQIEKENRTSSKFSEISLFTYIGILALLIVARDLAGISVNKYLFVLICTAFFVAAPIENTVYMLMFTVPLLCGLPGNYIIPIAFLAYFVKSKRINQKQLVFSIFIACMELFAGVFYDLVSIPDTVGYVTNLMFFFFLLYDSQEYDYYKCLHFFVLGTICTGAIIILATISASPTWMQDIASGQFRFGEIEHASEGTLNLTLNANTLAYYSIAGISCIAVLSHGSAYNKILLSAEMLFLTFAGLLTLSRAWVIVAVLMLVLYLFASCHSVKDVMISVIGLLLVFLFAAILLNRMPQLYEGIVTRLTRADIADGNGRIEITRDYLEVFDTNIRTMLFGTGVTKYQEIVGLSASLHNSLVQILICYGILGAPVFLYAWLENALKSLGHVKLLYWIPFLCLFVFSLSLQIVNPHYLIYPHLIAVFALKINKSEEEPQSSDEQKQERALNGKY